MDLLHEICSLPTAPFVEDAVIAYARNFARQRKIKVTEDETGNLLLERRGTQRNAPRWVFAAHMDHPGFISGKMLDDKSVQAAFRGWVLAEYLPGEKITFFTPDGEVPGTVIEAVADKKGGRAQSATVRTKGAVPPGCVGMWNQGKARIKGKRFYSRAIDDLGGLSAAFAMLDQLYKKPTLSTIAVLLTRAEEDGFIGAIAASLNPHLLKKTDNLVAIETSAQQPYAKQGDGVIVRIGDRTSVFNSSLSYFVTQSAEALRKKDKSFKYQRALMPGGTCESTVYDVYGFHAAAVCVPLGNYHNMDREKKKIGPEYIDVSDWQNMVKLFVTLAKNGHTYEPGHQLLKAKLEKAFGKRKGLL